MGNFSRNPADRAADALGKHYVGVRLQQAVPLLDADWNLLEDLRRAEHETLGRWFIGSGVPSGNDGFRILPATGANDFGIRLGLCLVQGKLTVNDADVRYTTQPNFGNPALDTLVAALATPGANKSYLVYLDVWDHEVDSQIDPSLVDARIGIETAVRLKRDWAVRVARVPEDLPLLDAPPSGHSFLRLAQLNRVGGNAAITAPMIVDLRETQLSVHRRIEVRDAAGNIVVDDDRFRQMLETTHSNTVAFRRYLSTQFNTIHTIPTLGEMLGLEAVSQIAGLAETGLSLLNSQSLANQGALRLLSRFYVLEQECLTVWRDVMLQLGGSPKKYAAFQNLVSRLNARLNDPAVGGMTGLLSALQAGDLEATTAMQIEIARLFGAASKSIPRGSIQVFLANSPPGNLLNGQLVRFEFRVRSFTTLADSYTVTVLPATGWPRAVVDASGNPIPNNKVAIGSSGAVVPIFVNTTVQTGSSDLRLRVVSDANPDEVQQQSNLFTLTENQPAPLGEERVQIRIESPFRATIDPASGEIRVSRQPSTQPASVVIRVFNNSGENATFQLAATIETGSQVGGWSLAFTGNPSEPITNGNSKPEGLDITAQSDAVSMTLLFTATATLAGTARTFQFRVPIRAT